MEHFYLLRDLLILIGMATALAFLTRASASPAGIRLSWWARANN
jgi:hypothetical protein